MVSLAFRARESSSRPTKGRQSLASKAHVDATNAKIMEEPELRGLIANAVPIGIGAVSADGRLVSANEALAQMFGFSTPGELMEEPLERFHEHPDVAVEVLLDHLEEGAFNGLEMDLVRADGTSMRVRLNATVRTFGDAPVIVGSVEDITVPTEMEEETAQSQKMEAVERFAAGLAHEYNNVLTAVIGESRQLLADLPPDEETSRAVANIYRAAKRASVLTRRLQVFSKSEVVRREVTDLSGAVRAAEASVSISVPSDVEVIWRLDAGRRRVRLPPQDIEQILSHLMANARDAMPAGGRVVVETGGVEAPLDTEGMEFHPPVPPGDYALLAVGDTGVGMNKETRSRIFDPFFTTKPFGAGAGLGLTTVYSLVARASGHVSVLSAPAYGTVVRILLPVCYDAAETDAVLPADAPGASAPHGTVLVVDDDQAVRHVVSRLLTRAGWTVIEAHDGWSALALVDDLDEPIDLLVTDVMMPRIKGTELAARIVRKWPNVRLLLISGYTDSPLIQQWVDVDPEVFLAKPFEPEDLLQRVRARMAAGD